MNTTSFLKIQQSIFITIAAGILGTAAMYDYKFLHNEINSVKEYVLYQSFYLQNRYPDTTTIKFKFTENKLHSINVENTLITSDSSIKKEINQLITDLDLYFHSSKFKQFWNNANKVTQAPLKLKATSLAYYLYQQGKLTENHAIALTTLNVTVRKNKSDEVVLEFKDLKDRPFIAYSVKENKMLTMLIASEYQANTH